MPYLFTSYNYNFPIQVNPFQLFLFHFSDISETEALADLVADFALNSVSSRFAHRTKTYVFRSLM